MPTSRDKKQPYVHFSPPCIGEEEIQGVVDAMRSNWLTTGPRTKEFESEFKEYVDAPDALAVNSCTAALHVALVTMGVGSGDEVITTPVTFAATANVVEHVGAKLVLADVRRDTLNIDVERIQQAITSRTKVILPVHYAGHPVDMTAVRDLAASCGAHVLEDAAHAIPAARDGCPVGSQPNPAAFSFYTTKNMTTSEGGMLTGEPEFLARARVVSLHGMSREAWSRYQKGGTWRYDVARPGYKYNMTDLQAAIGLAQLRKLDQFQARRRQIVAAYQAAFENDGALELPHTEGNIEHAWHLYVVRVRPDALTIGRDQFVAELHKRGIGTSVHFIPIHMHSHYRNKYGWRPEDFPVACQEFQRYFSLPLSASLSDEELGRVLEATLDVTRQFRRRRMAA